jgi:hypothetical protein
MSKLIGNWCQTEDIKDEYQLEIDDHDWMGAVAVVKEESTGKWWVMHANYEAAGGFDTPEEAKLAAEEYCRENEYPFEILKG